ncbi:hypothetical protein [Bacillus sp. AFS053548]|uniref:hypothetical protein n=1 Tax=Bacillus sp. AFS053548 TaxID=2033505 RepID=UPI00159BE9C8|nr:hypothetical protein [Bacillus sp. AFS053548]
MIKILSVSAILAVILLIINVSLSRDPKVVGAKDIWVGTTKDGNIQAVLSNTQEEY